MLGREFASFFKKKQIMFTGTSSEIDITNKNALAEFIHDKKFKWIINCAAYTAVDKAEEDSEKCRRINADGAGFIAETARDSGAVLIHISTDYVFNGTGFRPYTETDEPDPRGVYAKTKLEGETKIFSAHTMSYIIRTAWIYGKYGNNFVRTMLRLMNEKDRIKVVDDQMGSPTWTFDIVNMVYTLIKQSEDNRPPPYGIYHFTDEGECSWFDFSRAIYEEAIGHGIFANNCDIQPCKSFEYPSKAERPKYSVLDKTKLCGALNITIPHWRESLKKFMNETESDFEKIN
jgi:dTDP-4-dehydrorhamnose reductase